MHDPIAYTYDADTHCPSCAEARFGRCKDGWIACADTHDWRPGARDSEGNTVGVIAPWDEWCNPDDPTTAILACGTCRGVIEEHEHSTEPDIEPDYIDYQNALTYQSPTAQLRLDLPEWYDLGGEA